MQWHGGVSPQKLTVLCVVLILQENFMIFTFLFPLTRPPHVSWGELGPYGALPHPGYTVASLQI